MHLKEALSAVAPDAHPEALLAIAQLDLNSTLRVAHFLGQLAHESGFNPVSENLNYSAKRLMMIWPKRFPSLRATEGFARHPVALANKVYNGRMGNAPHSNDGWTYRGRGFIQLTGRTNYEAASNDLELDLIGNPDLVMQPAVSVQVANWFFTKNKIWPLADRNDVKAVTRRINGGLHGLADRRQKTDRALNVLNGTAHVLPTIRLWSRSAEVRLLQSALNELGFGPLAVDGVFGPGSVAALKTFQDRLGLLADGICGPQTWDKLSEQEDLA